MQFNGYSNFVCDAQNASVPEWNVTANWTPRCSRYGTSATRESSRRAFRALMEQPANVHDDAQHRNALIIIANNYSWSVATKQKKTTKKYHIRKEEREIIKDKYSSPSFIFLSNVFFRFKFTFNTLIQPNLPSLLQDK